MPTIVAAAGGEIKGLAIKYGGDKMNNTQDRTFQNVLTAAPKPTGFKCKREKALSVIFKSVHSFLSFYLIFLLKCQSRITSPVTFYHPNIVVFKYFRQRYWWYEHMGCYQQLHPIAQNRVYLQSGRYVYTFRRPCCNQVHNLLIIRLYTPFNILVSLSMCVWLVSIN